MNVEKLKEAERNFLMRYPGGFRAPEMMEIGKKHKMDKMVAFAQEHFALERFDDPEQVVTRMSEIVTKSSMISLFEKPKFRDYVKTLTNMEKSALAFALKELLHGSQEAGFEAMVDILEQVKMAKWTLITIFGVYYYPDREIFVKPTTTKSVVAQFELSDIVYKPKPTYEFYKKYRDYIHEMKGIVSESLQPNNAAFTGFLMMCIE